MLTRLRTLAAHLNRIAERDDEVALCALELRAIEQAMTPAWTSEPPTEPGWYWRRHRSGTPPTVYWWHRGSLDPRMGYEWLGPLEVPE